MAMTFNGYEIQNANFRITDIDHYGIPKKDVDLYALAYANKSSIATIDYPNKGIKVEGYIKCDDAYAVEAYIDILKGYLVGKNKELNIDYSGYLAGQRQYIATANKVDIKRTNSKNYATFTIDFICAEPFGTETSSQTITNTTGHTASTLTIDATTQGNAPVQYPIITITINSLTGTGDYIQITNDANGQDMLITGQSLAASDVLVIDTFERTVKINGVNTDYLGSFLELEPGENSLTYSDGFTTRNVDINIIYYRRWL